MEKTDLIAPITSLKFVHNLILSGEGPFLCVYNVSSGLKHICKQVLGNSRIHGIRVDEREETMFIVFGQKCLGVLEITSVNDQISVESKIDVITFPDLILDAHWLHDNEEVSSRIVIATAHNAVWCINYQTNAKYLIAQCEENSILYSAKFFGSNLNNLILAAGTVFNQILLWKIKGPKNINNKTQILHRLSGHEGVIFQVNFNASGTLMVSVSDDRSIRLWKLVLSESGEPQDVAHLCVMYGHGARVWDAKLLDQCIVSIGEDAVCNIWNYNGELVKKFTGHLGKSIWSLAASENGDMIATGGGDGSIRLYSLDGLTEQETIETVTTYLPGTKQGMVSKKTVAMDTPRSIILRNDGKLLVMTSEGCLYEYSWREAIEKQEFTYEEAWRLVLRDQNYSSYSLMSVSPDRKLVAFGNLAGNIKVCHITDIPSKSRELQPFTNKVLSLVWSPCASSYNLFSCGPEGIIIWWKLNIDVEHNIQIEQLQRFCIPHSKQRWASAVGIMTSSSGNHEDCHVIFGDRKGSIHLFSCGGTGRDDILQPVQTLHGLHGAIGVTQLCIHGDTLYSTGRDGTYRQYKLCDDRLQLIDTKKVFKGFEWVERLVFTPGGDIVIAGFHTAYFVVWSINKNEELFKVKCGGGHRAWDFSLHQLPESQNGEAVFTFLKGNSINTYTAQLKNPISHPILKPSFHGRETTCIANVCDLPLGKQENKLQHLFVTGSEDTTINLMSYDYTTGCISKLFTAQGHISSVRAVSVTISPSHDDAVYKTTQESAKAVYDRHSIVNDAYQGHFLLFSGGGRASLRCWQIDPSVVDRKGKLSSSPLSFLSEYSSRTSNYRRRRKRNDEHLHSEIRFMSLSSFPLSVAMDNDDKLAPFSTGLYGVVAACSDGFVRVFIFDEKESKFFLVAQTQYLLRCVLSVQHIAYENSTGRHSVIILAGDTAGNISLWDITEHLVEYIREEADENDGNKRILSNSCVTMETQSTMDDVTMPTKPASVVGMATRSLEKDYQNMNMTKHIEKATNNVSVALIVNKQESKHSCMNLVESSLGQPMHVFKAHQSGVNDISVYQGSSSFVTCSGGDDSALFFAEFKLDSTTNGPLAVNVIREEIIQSAHTSSVTGVSLLDESTMMSSSTDQRLKKWIIDNEYVKLDHVVFVDVPDVQAIEMWRNGPNGSPILSVCGVGIQTIRQHSSSSQ